MAEKNRVAILGATGMVGQQFIQALDGHPWFEPAFLLASARSVGRRYTDAIRDPETGAHRWYAEGSPPAWTHALTVIDPEQFDPSAAGADLVFSAVESDVAHIFEPRFAATTPVVSTARAFRDEPDVPILIPGVNDDHAPLIRYQQRRRGWRGFIAPQPNCTATGLAIALKPLDSAFGVEAVIVTSLQALSGAGRDGVAALEILDNIIPFIRNEEERVALETAKILGTACIDDAGPDNEGAGIRPHPLRLAATCTRVNVRDGHTLAVTAQLRRPATPQQVATALSDFTLGVSPRLTRTGNSGSSVQTSTLPSAPKRLIQVQDDPFRPQPRLDRDTGDGMTTVIGRIRTAPALPNGIAFVALSHNTRMGAAKGAVLTAELLAAAGYLQRGE